MLKIVEKSKIWFAISLIIIMIGLGCIAFKGLNFGIDFKGGTLVSIEMGKEVTTDDTDKVKEILNKYTKSHQVRETNNTEVEIIIKSEAIKEEEVGTVIKEVEKAFEGAELLEEETIGSTIGKELTKKAWIAIIVASVAMLAYIAVRFEFSFGIAAIIALIHDILIALSVYAIFGVKLNQPFIAAMLTILGYSINDTIVVFDRIRENKKRLGRVGLNELVNTSITQTLSRSINTSISTLFTIAAVFVFVPAIRELTLPLIVGVLSGSYSSIFIASPVWVMLKKKNKTAKA